MLTGHPITEAKFQVREYFPSRLHPWFVQECPCKSHRRECTPTVVLAESRRTVPTQRSRQQVAVLVMPVHSAKERHQIIFFRNPMVAFLPKPSLRFIVYPSFLFGKVHRVRFGDIVIGVIEMLPGVTRHHIHLTLDRRQILVVAGIEIEQQVTAQAVPCRTLTYILECSVQRSLWRTRLIETATSTSCHIVSHIQVQAQILETLNLIIHLKVSQASHRLSPVTVLLQHGQRIDTGQGIGIIRSSAVAIYHGFPSPISIVPAGIIMHRFGRVEESSSSHGPTIGKAGLVDGSLHIEVYGQMIV